MDEYQVSSVLVNFQKIFYVNFEQNFAGKSATFIQSMVQHRAIMRIVDNLHDLCCRGLKDYKLALENVQDYNLAKILTRKCTVPHYSGDIKQSLSIFNILNAVQMDIELYNYVDILFFEFRSGRLRERQAHVKEVTEIKYKEEEPEEEGERFHASVVFLPMEDAPYNMTFFRDNADFMNNYYINIVSRTFTDIEKTMKEYLEKNDDSNLRGTLKELDLVKVNWKDLFIDEVTASMERLEHGYSNIKNNIRRKLNIRSTTRDSLASPSAREKARA
mmetsp:Transcript_11821/g.18204  ORF Transcript_11821/g.18204 Transcript_11821/m.18204 type:complete len:274 (+) Transcript_11821:1779-2600(+)|eukprot:CAMPEP_0170501372 /NCGR_PEP_ID=MMETSP0208-20121228/38051_1 /TAXON_ID=197538 /ORGANISM="Strombidium inclinatum, Strain S3" /LENGTH=273 /DNA_ID=CAMNT_0010779867 /DNA_START=1782 /DNA_END=2603 /DNA_ORIENTATION=-